MTPAERLCMCDRYRHWYANDDAIRVCWCGHPAAEHLDRRGSCTGVVVSLPPGEGDAPEVPTLDDELRHVHHWCGRAARHPPHGPAGEPGWCNGFGLLAGPGCFGCRSCRTCKIPGHVGSTVEGRG